MPVDKSLISGSTSMLILKLLEEKDMYGYEMIETLREKSRNVFELKAGTLYPLLHGMESKGYVDAYEQEVLGKTRKYYRLTKEGKRFLKTKKEEWEEYSRAVARRSGRCMLWIGRNIWIPWNSRSAPGRQAAPRDGKWKTISKNKKPHSGRLA